MDKILDLNYQIGDYVVYKTYGVCIVDDVIEKDFGLGVKTYIKLKQFNSEKSIYYVPYELEMLKASIRPTLNKDEINDYIVESEKLDIIWEEDNKKRNLIFNEIINYGNVSQKLLLFKILNEKKDNLVKNKKRMYMCDEKALSTLEKIIVEEFSFVLNIEKSDVVPYINNIVKNIQT